MRAHARSRTDLTQRASAGAATVRVTTACRLSRALGPLVTVSALACVPLVATAAPASANGPLAETATASSPPEPVYAPPQAAAGATTTTTPVTTTTAPSATTTAPALGTTTVPAATTSVPGATTTTTVPGATTTTVPGATTTVPGATTTVPGATTTPKTRTSTTTAHPEAPQWPASRPAGYWMVTNAGEVASFGGLSYPGALQRPGQEQVVGIAPAAGAQGYWLAGAAGAVYPVGLAADYGGVPGGSPPQRVVAITSTPDGRGYWLAAATGGVFTRGDATYHGSMGAHRLNSPIVGMASTPDGRGYWLAAADGGVFAFGDATFLGSPRTAHLPSPVVGIAATPDGGGYRLALADGVVLDYGDASNLGSAANLDLAGRVVAIRSAPRGQGFWLLGADGGVITFGDARYAGSAYRAVPAGQRVVAMAIAPGSRGQATGAFGPGGPTTTTTTTTTVPPRTGTTPHRAPAPAPVPVPVPVIGAHRSYRPGATGYDVSWPQCGRALPPSAAVAIVGVNGGYAFSGNPCFEREARWAGHNLTTYINLNSPQGANSSQWSNGPAGHCRAGRLFCESYNYGYNTAQYSVHSAAFRGAHSRTWWLDVETASYWSSSQAANARVVAGAVAALRADRLNPAVYSTNYQWGVITGGYVPGTVAWYPTGIATRTPGRWCRVRSFAGGPVTMVQRAAGRFDGDYSC